MTDRIRNALPFLVVAMFAVVAVVAIARTPVDRFDAAASAARSSGLFEGKSAIWWGHRAHYRGVRIRRLRRELLRKWDYPDMIAIAATAYGVDAATLERKARCESANFTDFYNESSGASNVMQFLPSTWATTPYARFSIWNPFAAVLAGAWMHKAGRGGEWVCR